MSYTCTACKKECGITYGMMGSRVRLCEACYLADSTI